MVNQFDVILTGIFTADQVSGDVKLALSKLFKISPSDTDRLLTEAPVLIKKNVDRATAHRYKEAVEKVGALCDVVEFPSDLEDTAPPEVAQILAEQISNESLQAAADGPHMRPSGFPLDDRQSFPKSRQVAAARGAAWLGEGFRSFGKSPFQWLVIAIVGVLLSVISVGILFPILLGGLMLGVLRQDHGERLRFQTLFDGFPKHGLKLFLVGLSALGMCKVISLSTMMLVMPIEVSSLLDPEQMQLTGQFPVSAFTVLILLCSMLGTVLVTLIVWFAPPLIVLQEVPVLRALKLSFLGCVKNWSPFLVVYGSLFFLLLLMGALTLSLGYLVVFPVFVASVYFGWKDIFAD